MLQVESNCLINCRGYRHAFHFVNKYEQNDQ